MATKKATANQVTATTATATENKKSNRKAAPLTEEQKAAARKLAAQKAAETRRKNREAEEQELARRNEEIRRQQEEAEKKEAAAQKEAADKMKSESRDTWKRGKKTLQELEGSALYCFHSLNKLAIHGIECPGLDIDPAALLRCYEQINDSTPTARNLQGFSYDAVRVNYKGEVCRLMNYTAAAGDEIRDIFAGGYKIATTATTRTLQDVELIETYTGQALLIPVKVNRLNVFAAAQTVNSNYVAAAADLASPTAKKIEAAREETKRKKEEEARQKEINRAKRNAVILNYTHGLITAEEAAAQGVDVSELPTAAPAPVVELTTAQPQRRPWWKRIAAAF